MPRGDRTGPRGMGPMTGRAAGYCAGFGTPGFSNPVYRGGFGGGGHGWRNMFCATGVPGWMRFGGPSVPFGNPVPPQKPDPAWDKQVLKAQADALQSELDYINKCLHEIEPQTSEE